MSIDSAPFSELTLTIAGKAVARILLATEHVTIDAGAESVAIGLAQRWRLPLATVWPLVTNPEYEAVAPRIAAQAEAEIAAKIANFRIQSQAAGVLTTVKVRRGEDRWKEIVRETYSLASDLIILRQGPQRCSLFGFLAGEAMVNEVVACCPSHVLIVPPEAHIWSNRILVAVAANNQDYRTFTAAIGIASQWKLPLHLVVAIDDEARRADAQAFANAMQHNAEQSGVAMNGEIRFGEPAREILASMEKSCSDLIIMGTCDENHRGRAKVSGVMRKVLAVSKQPVLIVRV